MCWELEKHKVLTKYITLIRDMYDNVFTSVCASDSESDTFPVMIRLHQGSALSPFFPLVADEVAKNI